MGDTIALDADLDYRTDTIYIGNTITNSSSPPAWIGKMYRLTTNSGSVTLSEWGVSVSGARRPSVLSSVFPSAGTSNVGPITSAPTVTADDNNNIWVFFGTGRFYSTADKSNTDQQYFYGIKDPVITGGCSQSSQTNCEKKNLLNVSSAQICDPCASGTNQVTGVTGVTSFESGSGTTSLIGMVQSMDGWYTTLPTAGERNLSAPTILGGTVFFTTFVPVNDVCTAAGSGSIYALFYQTGSAYKSSVIGSTTTGSGSTAQTTMARSMSLGTGLPSQMAVQIGGQGSGAAGSGSSSGCAGRVTGYIQASTGALNQFCGTPALSSWSRFVSWISQRE
jgi:type IV pilus assembly protein PilY1